VLGHFLQTALLMFLEANYALSIRMAEYDQPELLDEIVRRSLITRTHKQGDFAEDDLIEETDN
jgi:hypothetical protein